MEKECIKGMVSTSNIFPIEGSITDICGKSYDNGIILQTVYFYTSQMPEYFINDGAPACSAPADSDETLLSVNYMLDLQYKELSGRIVLPAVINTAGLKKDNIENSQAVDILFYGDGRLLHSAERVAKPAPRDFSLDVSNVRQLTVKIMRNNVSPDIAFRELTNFVTYVALANLNLRK